jgi:hypothetical protein
LPNTIIPFLPYTNEFWITGLIAAGVISFLSTISTISTICWFDKCCFFTFDSETKLYCSSPLNIPNKEGIDEKSWRGIKYLPNTNLGDKNKIDEEITNLEWKRDKVGMLILNGKAYWLMNDASIINYNDFITHQIFGIPDYLEPGFASIENYLSRIFDTLAERRLMFKHIDHNRESLLYVNASFDYGTVKSLLKNLNRLPKK